MDHAQLGTVAPNLLSACKQKTVFFSFQVLFSKIVNLYVQLSYLSVRTSMGLIRMEQSGTKKRKSCLLPNRDRVVKYAWSTPYLLVYAYAAVHTLITIGICYSTPSSHAPTTTEQIKTMAPNPPSLS